MLKGKICCLGMYYTWENIRKLYENINLKYQGQHGTKNLNHQMDHIMHQTFKVIFSILSKNTKQ